MGLATDTFKDDKVVPTIQMRLYTSLEHVQWLIKGGGGGGAICLLYSNI